MIVFMFIILIVGWKICDGDEVYGCLDGNLSIKNMIFVWVVNMSGCLVVICLGGYVEVE